MLQIGAVLFYYKLGQKLLQIGTASLLQISASVITNGAAIRKKGNFYYKIMHLLKIAAKFNTNWARYYKLRQLLQIGA